MLILNEVLSDGRVMRAATALSERFDLEVIGWLRPERKDAFKRYEVRKLPFKVHMLELWTARHLPKNALGYAGRYIELFFRILKAGLSIKPATIHAHEISGLPVGYFLKKCTKAKLIYDCHELYRERKIYRSKIIIRIIGCLETLLIKDCDEIIACNRHRAEIMKNEYGAPTLPQVIHNLPPYSEPSDNNTKLRDFVKQRNIGIGRIIVHPGGIVGRGEEIVLAAMAKVPKNIGLIFIGDSAANTSEKMKRLAKQYNIENRIFVHPKVPYVELTDYMASADLGLVMYKNTDRNNYYCASNKIYEFAMCGLPIVAVDFPPCKEVLEKYHYGLCFTWNSPDELAQAINDCFKDENRYQRMRKEAIRAAKIENWDREKMVLMQIYSTLSKIS